MNRLIIIGNGFDLAHGLKTSYRDFITDYFDNVFSQINANQTEYKDDLFSVSRLRNGETIYSHEAFIESFKSAGIQMNNYYGEFQYSFVSEFFGKIIRLSIENWVDIENEYFQELMNVRNQPISSTQAFKIETLNNSFSSIKGLLEGYLLRQEKKICTINPAYESMNILLFRGLSYLDSTVSYKQDSKNVCVLNFNYTDTFSSYLKATSKIYKINIHGELKNDENQIVFGYGDEHHAEYLGIENLNNYKFMVNMKSMHYSKNLNYHRLLHFMDTGSLPRLTYPGDIEFEVLIVGHSCGLSDRTLFNTIFEHPNCKKIHACYYGNRDDHFYKTIEISRHFRNKQEMRKKFQAFNADLMIPQFQATEINVSSN